MKHVYSISVLMILVGNPSPLLPCHTQFIGWLISIGASAVWVAQRVPDDHIAVVANGFTIRGIDINDADNYMASKNIFEVARRAKLWDPNHGPFDFQQVYGLTVS